ncbi:zinc finger protein, partial [Colletotrichum plurivorum]
GPWKLLLSVTDTSSAAFTEILDTYQQLGDTLLLLLQPRELFSYDAHMAKVLSGIYKDVLEFHLQAFKYFQQPTIRFEFPTSGRWLFDKPEFKRWFDTFPPIPGLLWLNGTPGAGKTILSSLVIDEARGLARKPTVLYFYCKSNDKERDNFISIACSLLIQLLEQSPGLVDFFYEKYNVSTEAMLTTIPDIEGLLDIAIRNCTSVCTILDGLDKCPRDQRKTISQWFRSLVEDLLPAKSDPVRCLFVSQDDGIVRKDFFGITSLKIMPEDNQKDISQYCTRWASKLQDRFELSDDERVEIAARVPESCRGMILLARLTCENLFEQATYDDLELELEPITFLKGINDA